MSKRSKSLGRPGKGVLPPVSDEKKTHSKAKQRSLRDLSRSTVDLPSTSALPNGQLNSYMSSFSLGPRSVFSRRNTYGRNENSEQLYDVRDQLLAAKKQIAELNQKNKVLNTQLNRVTRESERREAHLQSIMAGRFQPAELNDTHLAVTLTSLEKQRFENQHIIKAQAKRIRQLERKMTNGNETEESISDDDYPGEESGSDEDGQKINGRSSQLSRQVPDEWLEKHKRKLELAKAHVEQNKELKAKIKELSAHLNETKKRLKTTEGSKVEKGRVSTADVNRIMDRIQENGLLRQQVGAATKELQKKFEEKIEEAEEFRKKYETLKSEMDKEKESVTKQLEEVELRRNQLEHERNEMQTEHNLRELQQEQLSGEMTDLEEERRRINEERDEWTRMRNAYEKQQISMEIEIRQMEDVIENLRRDNTALRTKLAGLREVAIGDAQINQRAAELEEMQAPNQSSPSRPTGIPRLDMRDMSLENSSQLPSVNSHTSQQPASPSALWDARINYLSPGIVAHIIRQDAIMNAAEEAQHNNT